MMNENLYLNPLACVLRASSSDKSAESNRRINGIRMLAKLADIANGYVTIPEIDQDLPPLIKEEITKHHQAEIDNLKAEGTKAAVELLNFATAEEERLKLNIKKLKAELKDAKKHLADIQACKSKGNQTTDYVPLVTLFATKFEMEASGVTRYPDELIDK